ncbi:GNAT family N-acetyltransferase [Cellvibrio sp. NN19]|uniref:GNAT family N-acetyltransferase n=1 Tax=Cellvibrio chitinivorans TaxID=3102792 RepID=UPI002B40EEE8|nr:GNAT family N-acetyltransferase [Cellvibrio sp. NN19]
MPTIRRAIASDADAINKLYSQLTALSPPVVLAKRIDFVSTTDHTYLLVCESDTNVIATALVCLCQDVMYGDQPFAVVENVVVSGDYLRKGIGKQLMEYIESLCLEKNCSKIMLQTNNKNHGARDFYSALGYSSDAKVGFIKYRRHFS